MIEVSNLNKSYDKTVIRDLSFRLDRGETMLVTGVSGSGKTTLFRMLLGLEKPDSGRITCREEKLSAVFQEDRLLEELSIADNIRLVSDHGREAILTEYKKLLPEESFPKRIREYSGGMKRRAAVLRAVMSDSTAILLDEPFQGLDRGNRQRTMRYILDNRRGRTLLFFVHDISEAACFRPQKVVSLTSMYQDSEE